MKIQTAAHYSPDTCPDTHPLLNRQLSDMTYSTNPFSLPSEGPVRETQQLKVVGGHIILNMYGLRLLAAGSSCVKIETCTPSASHEELWGLPLSERNEVGAEQAGLADQSWGLRTPAQYTRSRKSSVPKCCRRDQSKVPSSILPLHLVWNQVGLWWQIFWIWC